MKWIEKREMKDKMNEEREDMKDKMKEERGDMKDKMKEERREKTSITTTIARKTKKTK